MLKKAFLVIAVLVVAAFCVGWTPDYNVEYYQVKVGSGTTLWDIAERYHGANKFHRFKQLHVGEYLHEIRHDVHNQQIDARGGMLLVGDVVYVPIYTVK